MSTAPRQTRQIFKALVMVADMMVDGAFIFIVSGVTLALLTQGEVSLKNSGILVRKSLNKGENIQLLRSKRAASGKFALYAVWQRLKTSRH